MQDQTFIVDDIRHYQSVMAEFGIDISGLVADEAPALQVDREMLAMELESQIQQDADHQFEEWIKRDRAFEAIGLIESDGANIGVDGQLGRLATSEYQEVRKKEAYINLIKTNRDRVVNQLEGTNLDMAANATDKKDNDAVEALNKYKNNVLDDNNFENQMHSCIKDGVTYGTGIMTCEHTNWMDSPDISLNFNQILASGRALTLEEFYRLRHSLYKHDLRYANTFEFIRYRGAKGEAATNYNDPVHRWLHRVEQIPIPQLRKLYPQVKTPITHAISSVVTTTNPNAYIFQNITDTATRYSTWVRFPVSGEGEVKVQDPFGGEDITMSLPINRYAVAKFTMIEGIGIVDIDIDEYNHNRFPVVNWSYSTSSRHSCGIGIVKYGRDAQVIHTKLYNGMLRLFDTMAKGGGFVDARLGLTADQLDARSKEGTYIPVKIPAQLQESKLSDLIIDTRPAQMPPVYAEMLGFHSNAIDETMSVPNSYKGIQEGNSGRQEQILQQQAEAVQGVAVSSIELLYRNLAVILFANIVQFERHPFTFYHKNKQTGENEKIQMNTPEGYYIVYNEETGEMELHEYGLINSITNLMFQIEVSTRSIVPHKAVEKAAFYSNFYGQTVEAIQDPVARIYLDEINQEALRIPAVGRAIKRIDEFQAEQAQGAAEAAQEEQQREAEKEQHERKVEAAKLAQDQQKIDQDLLAKAKPNN